MTWLLPHTSKFPLVERFRLAKRIDDALFEFHTNILCAAKINADTTRYLQHANIELDKLRIYLRLSLELHYTSPNQFEYAAEKIAEMGRLLGGWMKKA